MNFVYIFIINFAIVFLKDGKAETAPLTQRNHGEPFDSKGDSRETDMIDGQETPEEIDNIIRQRRKTIEDLLKNFKEDVKRERDTNQETLNDKRSLHRQYSNPWRSTHDKDTKISNIHRDISEIHDGGNAITFRGSSFKNSEVVTESSSLPSVKVKQKPDGGNDNDDNNMKKKGKQQDSSGGKAFLGIQSNKDDMFNADLQDYDDDEDYYTIKEKPRSNYRNVGNFGMPERYQNNPYTCCLCGECNKPLDTGVGNYHRQHYMRPEERDHFIGATQKDESAYWKLHVGRPDIIKTVHLKSYGKIPDRDSYSEIGNVPLNDPYALYMNNLSHEANYKLSKLEQDPEENKMNLSWVWPKWGLQKRQSLQFNPMNEIKLKTSNRLMQRGFGPSLPSYSLGENRRENMIDNILKRKEMELQKANRKYNDLEDMKRAADPAELWNIVNWSDVKSSDSKPNTITNEWTHIREKRVSDEQRSRQENEDIPLIERFKREAEEKLKQNNLHSKTLKVKSASKLKSYGHHNSNAFMMPNQKIPIWNDFVSLNLNENSGHRLKRSKRSTDTMRPARNNSKSLTTRNRLRKRDGPFFNDLYDDYNSFQASDTLSDNLYQEPLDEDLENLNKGFGGKSNINENLYRREGERSPQLTRYTNWHDQNRFLRSGMNNLQSNKTAYKNTNSYLRYQKPSDNYLNLKSEIDSKFQENDQRMKKFDRVPPHRQPNGNKEKTYTNNKRGSKIENQKQNLNQNFNSNNFNLKPFQDYSNLYKNYPDLKYHADGIDSIRNSSRFKSADTAKFSPNTNSVLSDEDSNKISLNLRNEILNCTAFSNLKEFLKALPKNITQDLLGTTTARTSEEIEMDFTTLDIKDPSTENPADTITEIDTTTKSTDFEPWETTTLDCSNTTLLPETTEEVDDNSITPIPDDDNSTWDDSLSGATSIPESSPPSSLNSETDNVNLNITINANVQGNTKDKNFNGNGTFNVKPGLEEDHFGRHIHKRKCSPRPKTRPSINDDTDDLSSGKLSAKIVKAVFNEVQENPDLKILWPSLKRNQLSERTQMPYFYSIRDKDNEDQLQESQKLMAKSMEAINDIIDQQIRSRSCVVLRPDLQEFYDLIVKTNQQQENNREKRENSKDKLPTVKPKDSEDKIKSVKKLLRQFEGLSQQEQQKISPIHEILLSELNSLTDVSKRHSKVGNEKRSVGVIHDKDEITNILKKYYTPQYLKLQKASDLYRSISNGLNDGMP